MSFWSRFSINSLTTHFPTSNRSLYKRASIPISRPVLLKPKQKDERNFFDIMASILAVMSNVESSRTACGQFFADWNVATRWRQSFAAISMRNRLRVEAAQSGGNTNSPASSTCKCS